MKRRTLLSAMPALGLGLVTNRVAADNRPKPLLLSSGGVNGTYYRLMKEFDATSPGLIINQELDGSLTNIDRIMDNQAELGITQFDVLDTRYKKETVLRDRIRILAQLHHEEIHFIAKSPPKIEGGVGAFGFTVGGRTVTLNTIDDLRDRKLAIWGGSLDHRAKHCQHRPYWLDRHRIRGSEPGPGGAKVRSGGRNHGGRRPAAALGGRALA